MNFAHSESMKIVDNVLVREYTIYRSLGRVVESVDTMDLKSIAPKQA